MKKISKKNIQKRLANKATDRKATTVYLSQKLFRDFRKACHPHSVSEVLEECMREYIS
jgi:hypothetical protein